MPRFLIEATYSAQGVTGVRSGGGSARRDAIVHLAESVGGRMETFDFAFGRSDVVTICDLPDNAAAAAVILAVNSSGAVNARTTVLLSPEEVDRAAQQSADYRAPGHVAGRESPARARRRRRGHVVGARAWRRVRELPRAGGDAVGVEHRVDVAQARDGALERRRVGDLDDEAVLHHRAADDAARLDDVDAVLGQGAREVLEQPVAVPRVDLELDAEGLLVLALPVRRGRSARGPCAARRCSGSRRGGS